MPVKHTISAAMLALATILVGTCVQAQQPRDTTAPAAQRSRVVI